MKICGKRISNESDFGFAFRLQPFRRFWPTPAGAYLTKRQRLILFTTIQFLQNVFVWSHKSEDRERNVAAPVAARRLHLCWCSNAPHFLWLPHRSPRIRLRSGSCGKDQYFIICGDNLRSHLPTQPEPRPALLSPFGFVPFLFLFYHLAQRFWLLNGLKFIILLFASYRREIIHVCESKKPRFAARSRPTVVIFALAADIFPRP